MNFQTSDNKTSTRWLLCGNKDRLCLVWGQTKYHGLASIKCTRGSGGKSSIVNRISVPQSLIATHTNARLWDEKIQRQVDFVFEISRMVALILSQVHVLTKWRWRVLGSLDWILMRSWIILLMKDFELSTRPTFDTGSTLPCACIRRKPHRHDYTFVSWIDMAHLGGAAPQLSMHA